MLCRTTGAAQATTSPVLLNQMQAQRAGSAYVTAFSDVVQRSLRTVLPDVAGLELVGGSAWTSTGFASVEVGEC